MPRHNRPDLAQRLREKYDTDPPGAFDTISPEIVGVSVVEDLTKTEAVQACIGSRSESAGGAGQLSQIGFMNRDGSGQILDLYQVFLRPAVNDTIEIRLLSASTVAAWAGAGNRAFQDRRLSGRTPIGEPRGQTAGAAAGNLFGRVFALSAGGRQLDGLRFTIPPGQAVAFNMATANQDFYATFFWTQRVELEGD